MRQVILFLYLIFSSFWSLGQVFEVDTILLENGTTFLGLSTIELNQKYRKINFYTYSANSKYKGSYKIVNIQPETYDAVKIGSKKKFYKTYKLKPNERDYFPVEINKKAKYLLITESEICYTSANACYGYSERCKDNKKLMLIFGKYTPSRDEKKKFIIFDFSALFKQNHYSLPIISWEAPPKNATILHKTLTTLSACIQSQTKIKEVKLFINNELITDNRGLTTTPISDTNNENCTLNFQQEVELINGVNVLELHAINDAGTTISEARKIIVSQQPNILPSKRIALVIGNQNYTNPMAVLKNPQKDATAIAERLQNMGFTVIQKLDLDYKSTQKALKDFTKQLKKYDDALLFYAGHGFQVEGENYMLPIDAAFNDPNAIQTKGLKLADILSQMEAANDGANILMVDACRNVPTRGAFDNVGMTYPNNRATGSLIAFSTAPNSVAYDGNSGEHSPYAAALLKHLHKGQSLTDLLTKVRVEVGQQTGEKQIPWYEVSLKGVFVF